MGIVDYQDETETAEPDAPLAYQPDEKPDGLAQIALDVQKRVAEPTRIRHPGLEQYVLVFRSNIETAEAQSVEKRTKNSKKPVRDRNALFLAVTNIGLERDGEPVENSDGKPVTFRDGEFLKALGAKTAADCVVKFLQDNDGYLISIAEKVATAAGFGTDVEVVQDPTWSA